ncbi:MAG: esterase/lipase family protein [Planctomycetaceae bacterium]
MSLLRTTRLAQLAVLLCIAFTSGCATRYIRVRDEPYNPLIEHFKISVTGRGQASERTKQFLLASGYSGRGTPAEQLEATKRIHGTAPSVESTHAIAELNFIVGRNTEYRDSMSSMEFYYDSMAAAYGFLFHSRFGPVRNPDDPQFAEAVDLYNSSLERLLRIAKKHNRFAPGTTLVLPISGRSIQFVVTPGQSSWEPRHYGRFEFVSDFDVEGLAQRHYKRGLGVPLIAVRKQCTDRPEIDRYYAEDLSFPVTAFVRFHEAAASAACGRHCQLEFHNPYESQCIDVHGLTVPLHTDITTPLAWFLDRPKFRYLDTWGLIRPSAIKPYSGLYMLQPYQQGKIPVLMVHGIWSSPMTWMPMMNDLMARPEIRDRYQFWLYLYPSGEPFWFAAADLRDELTQARNIFDPGRQDPQQDKMVVVGHSMGGLISRMLTQNSGDRFWSSVSRTPFSQTRLDPQTRQQLQRVYYFQPHPSVGRVVTIASPFGGSSYANRFTRWLARSFISLPGRTLDTMSQVFRTGSITGIRTSTSVDGLAPDSPILRAIEGSPLNSSVAYHNIVAIKDEASSEPGDGVVTFDSAARVDVRSQLVVPAHHSNVQRHPQTVHEVFRILMRHLQETGTVPPLPMGSPHEFPAPVNAIPTGQPNPTMTTKRPTFQTAM